LWRLQLNGWDAESNILVYPKVIRFGNQPVETAPEDALRNLLPHAKALRDAWLRPQRALVAFLRGRLPDAVREIGDQAFFVIGILDSFEGNYSLLTICLLIPGDNSCVIDMEGPPGSGDDFLSTGGTYYVNIHGTLVPDSPEDSAFCVQLWLPPADYRGPLTLIETTTGRRHIYEVKSEAITRLAVTD
jgi:hypothetical protein